MKALIYLPHESQPDGLKILEHHINENYSAISAQIFCKFRSEMLASTDPKGVPGTFSEEHMLRILNLSEEPGPHIIDYDADWPGRYLECYKLRKLQQSKSIIDMF